MSRETKAVLLSVLLVGASVVLQSTLLPKIAIRGVKPDLTLVVLIFVSLRRGAMTGQLVGFAAGLAEDVVSLAPLGFHALMRCIAGFVYGLFLGNVFVDPLLMPLLFVLAGTLAKGILSGLLVVVFGASSQGFAAFAGPFWIEMLYNALLAPFVFALLGLIKLLRPMEKKKP